MGGGRTSPSCVKGSDQKGLHVPVRRFKGAVKGLGCVGGLNRAPSATLITGRKKDHEQGRALSKVLRHGHGFDSEGWFEEFELTSNKKLRAPKVTRERGYQPLRAAHGRPRSLLYSHERAVS